MAPLYPSFTSTYHHTPYPTISPSQPHLSASSSLILITGAGRGIGQAIALAFAHAHAKGIALIGRSAGSLAATTTAIHAISPTTDVFAAPADITQPAQVDAAMAAIVAHFNGEAPHVLVNNAGGVAAWGAPLTELALEDVWATFETNVKGPLAVTQAFARAHKSAAAERRSEREGTAATEKVVTVVNVSSGVVHLPSAPGAGAYAAAKMAGAKMAEILHYEQPEWNVFNLHPGVVMTDLARQAGRKAPDAPELPAGVVVWLARDPRARVLNGRFLWANWDIDELLAREREIKEGGLLEMGLKGWAEGCTAEDLMRRARSVHPGAE